MDIAIITGAAGLIGAEAVRHFSKLGFRVAGIDNDMRKYFFGDTASTEWSRRQLESQLPAYAHHAADIRDEAAMDRLFAQYGTDAKVVIHCASQPSHDWAAREPMTDFTVNAVGTLVLLEAMRRFAPEAVFIFTSTNKVYGDTPNRLPLVETATRWELDPAHRFAEHGIDESMSIDDTMHSVFGASPNAVVMRVIELPTANAPPRKSTGCERRNGITIATRKRRRSRLRRTWKNPSFAK